MTNLNDRAVIGVGDVVGARLARFISDEILLISMDLRTDTDLLLTGAVDSLGVIRITQWMEDELGIDVDPGDVTLENFQTVDRMATYASSRTPDA